MRQFLLYFIRNAFLLLLTVFIVSFSYKKHCENTVLTLLQSPRALLIGDSHAQQLDLTETDKISCGGSSLYLPLAFLEKYRAEIPKNKPILISVWHNNISQRQENISIGERPPAGSLDMFSDASSFLNFSPFWRLESFKARLLFITAYLSVHHNILDDHFECFIEELEAIPKSQLPEYSAPEIPESAIEKINCIAKSEHLRLLWVISPELKALSSHYAEANLALDSILNLHRTPNIKILDLRVLDLPFNHFRDEHHINCKAQAIIDSLVCNALQSETAHALQLP